VDVKNFLKHDPGFSLHTYPHSSLVRTVDKLLHPVILLEQFTVPPDYRRNDMKKMLLMVAPFCLIAATAVFAEGPSIERGKALFGSAALGTNGKSCETCHPGGARLTEAAGYGEGKLKKIINSCISTPLAGKKLADDSMEMKSLVMYISSLGAAKK
jgi:hypothetical protein